MKEPQNLQYFNFIFFNLINYQIKFKLFSKTLTKEGYRAIIEKFLVPFIQSYSGPCRLIQYNCSSHSSEFNISVLSEHNIRFVCLHFLKSYN